MKYNFTKGFTVLEILFVLSILGILFAIVTPQFTKMRDSQVLNSATADVLSVINKASSQSLASLDSSAYGVHFASDRVTLFKGTVYDQNAATNQVVLLTAPATITAIGFGGPTSLYFERLTGTPNVYGTVTIGLTSGVHVDRSIIIDRTGRISAN